MSIACQRTRRRQQSNAALNLRGTLCLPNFGRAMRRRLTTTNSRTAEDRRSEPRLTIHASPALDGRVPSVRRASAADRCGWQRWRAEKAAPLLYHCRRQPMDAGNEKATRSHAVDSFSFAVVVPKQHRHFVVRRRPDRASPGRHVERGAENGPQQAIPATSGYTQAGTLSLFERLCVPCATRCLGNRRTTGSRVVEAPESEATESEKPDLSTNGQVHHAPASVETCP